MNLVNLSLLESLTWLGSRSLGADGFWSVEAGKVALGAVLWILDQSPRNLLTR
jgi:hypothetical protein